MIQKACFILFFFVLFACSDDKKISLPPTILPKQKMAEVIIDVHLLEAAMSLNTYQADQIKSGNPTLPFDVFSKHKISKKQYQESFDYYTLHPQLLAELYQIALENLSKMQAEVNNKKEVEKVKVDSVKIILPKKAKNKVFKGKKK